MKTLTYIVLIKFDNKKVEGCLNDFIYFVWNFGSSAVDGKRFLESNATSIRGTLT